MKHHPETGEVEKKLIANLREKGYKLTPQRIEIIKLLSHDRSHPGAMDIFQKVRQRMPQISMSTVYYALDMLKKEGLIRELEFYEKDNRYDITVSDHINLICKKCGKIEDFTEAPPFSHEMIEERTGFQPLGMRFEYYGYCKVCGVKKKR